MGEGHERGEGVGVIIGVEINALQDGIDPATMIAELIKAGVDAYPASATLMEVEIESARQIAICAQTEKQIREAYRTAAAVCRIQKQAASQQRRAR